MGKRDGPTAALLVAIAGTLLTFYAALDDWQGVRSYGPRYLVPILPLLCVPLAYPFKELRGTSRGKALVVAVLFSALVQLPAVMIDPSRIRLQTRVSGGTSAAGPDAPDEPGPTLATAARAAGRAIRLNAAIVSGAADRPRVQPTGGNSSLSDRMAFSLDFWWMYLYHLGVLPAAAALGSALACAALGALMLVALMRSSPRV
jgi:hypothetical protein